MKNLCSKLLVICILLLTISNYLYSQKDSFQIVTGTLAEPNTSSLVNQPQTEPNSLSITRTPLTALEFYLSILVLVFGLGVILFETILIRANKISLEVSFKYLTITLIITSTLFLITAGYSNNQIAPAVGLLGTIAGYLLGKGSTQTNADNQK